MVVIDNPKQENLKQTTSYTDLHIHKKKRSMFTQANTILYKTNTQQSQINASTYLLSWEIPPMYYHANIDPVKAFLQHNTIRNYKNRLYWKTKETCIYLV